MNLLNADIYLADIYFYFSNTVSSSIPNLWHNESIDGFFNFSFQLKKFHLMQNEIPQNYVSDLEIVQNKRYPFENNMNEYSLGLTKKYFRFEFYDISSINRSYMITMKTSINYLHG